MGSPFGTWSTISIRLPAEIEELTKAVNDVGEFAVNIFNISLQILNLVRASSIGYLDPIQALLDAVIKEIEKLFTDLSEIGFYMTGDWDLLRFPFDDLLGGYQGYERRMIARLADRTDPTRPDLTEATKVFGLFLFVSADPSNIRNLAQLLKSFQNFFGKRSPDVQKVLPTPGKIEALYGAQGVPVYQFQKLGDLFKDPVKEAPTLVRLTWTTPASSGKNPNIPFTYPAPSGFLVEVSTVPQGLSLYYERPQADAATVLGSDGKTTVQMRESGPVLDPNGKPLVVYGGIDQLKVSGSLYYNSSIDSKGNMIKGRSRIFALRSPNDKNPIPLDQLFVDGKYLLQRTFYVSSNVEVFFPNTSYGISLNRKDFPYEAVFEAGSNGQITAKVGKQPSTYYVRVTAVSNQITDPGGFRYNIAGNRIKTPGVSVQAIATSASGTISLSMGSDRGDSSAPLTLTFPNENTKAYMDILTVSLAVLVLSRPDLPVLKDQPPNISKQECAQKTTGLEQLASIMRKVYLNPSLKFGEVNVQPLSFRTDLLNRCRKVAEDLYNLNGPNPKLEKILITRAAKLLTWKWGDSTNADFKAYQKEAGSNVNLAPLKGMTLLQSLDTSLDDQGGNDNYGVGLSPWNVRVPEDIVARDFFVPANKIMGSRLPAFFEIVQDLQKLPSGGMNEVEAQKYIKAYPNLTEFIQSLRTRVRDADGKERIVYQVPEEYQEIKRIIGSADHSAVVYQLGDRGRVFFCRNVIDQEIFDLAGTVLNLAAASLKRPSADGEWIATKIFWALPQVKQIFDTVINWLKTIKGGNKAITDALQNCINIVEARILEIQELIQRLSALIQQQLVIDIPPASGLLLVESGTEGILAGLTTANNKPQDSPTAYGGGVALLAGGVPALIIDFISGV